MTAGETGTSTAPGTDTDAFVARLFDSFLGLIDVMSVYFGYRLGWYASLADDGPATAAELAARTRTNERYAREWLEQQAAAEILMVDDPAKDAGDRTYRVPPAVAEALTDRESPNFVAPLAQVFAAALRQNAKLVDAMRRGAGVSWDEFGDEMRDAQADQNRVFFHTTLTDAILPAIPDMHARLVDGARVADIACGAGWSSIAIAKAFPRTRVDGFDIDAPSIDMAKRNLVDSGVEDRVRFEVQDASDPQLVGRYDLVIIVEALHDVPRPVELLRVARALLSERGRMLVIDEKTADRFAAPAETLDRLFYGFSLLVCLPDGMSRPSSAATGTVMRPDTLRGYASAAGFSGVETVDVDAGFFRVYLLTP